MEPKQPAGRELGQAWRYEALGYTFAFSIILFAGAGYLLDRWLGIRPILTIVGTLVGVGVALTWVFLKVQQDEAARRTRREREGPGPP